MQQRGLSWFETTLTRLLTMRVCAYSPFQPQALSFSCM